MRARSLTYSLTAGLLCCLMFSAAPALAAAPEEPLTEAAKEITGTTATLRGELNPHTEAVTGYEFTYNTNGACAGTTTAAGAEAEVKASKVSTAVTGLEPNREYTFCIVATHLEGETTETTPGSTVSFKTEALAPEALGESVSGLTPTSADLEAKVNPDNQETTYFFEYATSEEAVLKGEATKIEGAPPAAALPSVFAEQLAGPVDLGSLTAGTTYYYRVVAENEQSKTEAKPVEGAIESFTTLDIPVVTTEEAQNITRTGATVSGTVDPVGAASTYHIAYVEAADYEAQCAECEDEPANPYRSGATTPESSVGADYTVHQLPLVFIGELKPGTTYDYAVVATNALGTEIGPNQQFTTSPAIPPIAVTGEAVGVTQINATLTGSVDTRGLQSTLEFELGTTPYAGSVKPATISSEAGTVVGIYTSYANVLLPGTTYYYRVLATNADGTEYGAERSFVTTSFTEPASFPQTPLLAFPASETKATTKVTTRVLTNAQKLSAALKTCRRDKSKGKRVSCEKQAQKKYSPAKKKKKK